YHLQANGLTERMNRTLTDIIASFINTTHTNWDNILPFVTFAINTSRQSSLGYSPYRLLYGREATRLLDCIFPTASPTSRADVFSENYARLAAEARQRARALLDDAQAQQTSYYDARHRDI